MKTLKTYRLENFTLNRLAWLAADLKMSETAVVEMAITDLYLRSFYDLPQLHTAPSVPRCCRPVSAPCPLDSSVPIDQDITADMCQNASCPHLLLPR